jgi:pyridoxamine 5'-phosphate oxidase
MPSVPAINFDQPPAEPLTWFNRWFDEAKAIAIQIGLPNPNAMTLATVDAPPESRPSARIVLLKSIDERGVVFFTNRESRKGAALAARPRAALLFHWDALDRQVRIEGGVSEVSETESDAYWATRARLSQIGAWASRQSRTLESREQLEIAVAEIMDRHTNDEGIEQPIPRPPHWGGYRVALEAIEFWQGHPFRLHDRVEYRKQPDGSWRTRRLWP